MILRVLKKWCKKDNEVAKAFRKGVLTMTRVCQDEDFLTKVANIFSTGNDGLDETTNYFNESNSQWMKTELFSKEEGNLHLDDLTIVGTHDSTAYYLSDHQSPDLSKGLITIHDYLMTQTEIGSIFTDSGIDILENLIRLYGLTQRRTIKEQLQGGVRFFDFRICFQHDVPYACHGMYGHPLETYLKDITTFLDHTTHELVFLRFSHFHDDYKLSPLDFSSERQKFSELYNVTLPISLADNLSELKRYRLFRKKMVLNTLILRLFHKFLVNKDFEMDLCGNDDRKFVLEFFGKERANSVSLFDKRLDRDLLRGRSRSMILWESLGQFLDFWRVLGMGAVLRGVYGTVWDWGLERGSYGNVWEVQPLYMDQLGKVGRGRGREGMRSVYWTLTFPEEVAEVQRMYVSMFEEQKEELTSLHGMSRLAGSTWHKFAEKMQWMEKQQRRGRRKVNVNVVWVDFFDEVNVVEWAKGVTIKRASIL